MIKLLKLGVGNAKLNKDMAIFDLPAGWTCPYAKDCGDKVCPTTGKLIKNAFAKFRCFSATSELVSPTARRKRWYNLELIKSCKTSDDMANLIATSILTNKDTKKASKVRIHTSGDFFNEKYFKAWLTVAKLMPEKMFYAYTKSLKFWVANIDDIPENFHLTASEGGKTDNLIELHSLKSVTIVYSEEEAVEKGLEIDHDDSHCYDRNCKKFALLIHGTQPKGSKAMEAVMTLRKKGVMGYDRGKIGKGRQMEKK